MVSISFDMFFDKPLVLSKVKDGTKSAESKMGQFVRQRAKTSIRKRKKIAQPGSPPSSHAGQLRDLIYFGYDAATETTVVGPLLFKSTSKPTGAELQEFGGRVVDPRSNKTLNYRPHPYMGPALEAEAPNFPNLFANVI